MQKQQNNLLMSLENRKELFMLKLKYVLVENCKAEWGDKLALMNIWRIKIEDLKQSANWDENESPIQRLCD